MINFPVKPWRIAGYVDTWAGFWPYHSWHKKGSIMAYHSLIIMSIAATQVYSASKHFDDNWIFAQTITSATFILGDWSKLFGLAIRQDKRRRVYDKVSSHFRDIVDEEEAKILRDFAHQGFRYAIIYLAAIATTCGAFSAMPLARSLANYYYFSDGQRQFSIDLPIVIDFSVDKSNDVLIAMYFYYGVFAVSCFTMVAGFDLSFILQVFHARALVKIFTVRLGRVTRWSIGGQRACESEQLTDGQVQALLKETIELHCETYDFLSLMENEHSISFFVMLLLNSACFAGMIHLIAVSIHDPLESLRHAIAFSMLLIHFYMMFSQGQNIIDTTSGIIEVCYDCEWFYLPKKMRTLWLIIMIRSFKPCQLSGGKCFVLCLETYSKMLKAGASYYTVFEN